MGYVGQHLTSVVTGIPGGRSGARGHDLFDPKTGHFFEIKTCTRVDQLGACSDCGANVAAIELECPSCQSTQITRKDDSKWLITPQTIADMSTLFDPELYFLVLFDFKDLKVAEDINARIYSVDPKSPGFSLCMVDYWLNIKSKSKSGAPFNLWPFSFKFELMEPQLIYHAVINKNDQIKTLLFPGRDKPQPVGLAPLTEHASARTFTEDILNHLADEAKLKIKGSFREKVEKVEDWRNTQNISDSQLIQLICRELYWNSVQKGLEFVPKEVKLAFKK